MNQSVKEIAFSISEGIVRKKHKVDNERIFFRRSQTIYLEERWIALKSGSSTLSGL